jgi:hypothetical protein
MAKQMTRFVSWPYAPMASPVQHAWQRVRALPPAVRITAWAVLAVVFAGPSLLLLAVPVVIGVWLWETIRKRAGGAARTDLWRWIGHFAEMVVAMYVGMLVYHMLVAALVVALGFGGLVSGDLGYAWMTLSMVVPMVALMRFQGHSWRMSNEMAAGMVAPIVACFALVRLGICPLVPFLSWLSATSVYAAAYYGMLLGMLAVMVYRRDMYAGCAGTTTHPQHTGAGPPEGQETPVMRATGEVG